MAKERFDKSVENNVSLSAESQVTLGEVIMGYEQENETEMHGLLMSNIQNKNFSVKKVDHILRLYIYLGFFILCKTSLKKNLYHS